MSFLDIFRSPGRKLTAEEEQEINGTGETLAQEMSRIAKAARIGKIDRLVASELEDIYKKIATHAARGENHVRYRYMHLKTDPEQRKAHKRVVTELRMRGFKVHREAIFDIEYGWKVML